MQTPDNVIGETLVVQGRVEFQNLLRIDGHFEVSLTSFLPEHTQAHTALV